MSRLVRVISLGCILVTAAFGQRFGYARGGHVGFRPSPGFHRIGRPFFFPQQRFFSHRPFFFGSGLYYGPTIWPMWMDDYGYGYPPAPPNVTIIAPPSYPSGPEVIGNAGYPYSAGQPVVINQYFGSTAPAAPAVHNQVYFSIALKDHAIYTALAYWVEGDTLHFITTEGRQKPVPLNEVDRALSERLTRERGVDFGLPAPK